MKNSEVVQLIKEQATEDLTYWDQFEGRRGRELDLSANQLRSLPPEIGLYNNFALARLSHNQLTSLPPEIGGLTNLTSLDLSYNRLTSLPHEIGGLTNLRWLYLSHNQLTSLPPEIGELTNLSWLYLSGNLLTLLPEVLLKLTNLTTLYLSRNQIEDLPKEIEELTNLTRLYLSANPLISPPEIVPQGIEVIRSYFKKEGYIINKKGRKEKMGEIEDYFKVNPVLLKSASAEDDTSFRSLIETKEYENLQYLCKENRSKKNAGYFNPYNIALIGNYGTGKSKIAFNLRHEFEGNGGIGFYTEISGVTAGQIITNIYRDLHEKLFGLRRLVYTAATKGFWGGLFDKISKSKYKIESSEGTIYFVPEEHLKHIIIENLNLEDTKESRAVAFNLTGEIHENFREAFAGIAELSENFGSIEIILPEEKVTALISAEKAAQHLGAILNTLNKPVLFILDELEKIYKLDRLERVKFLDFIRALIDINKGFVFIFCFTRFSFDSLIKQHAALYSRIPVIISLKNFTRTQFDQFMDNRFKQGLIEGYTLDSIFEESFFDVLWEITAGNQRSSLFILDRFIEFSRLNEYEPRYDKGDLIAFLEFQPNIKDQLLDMLLYDVKERAQIDPKMSVILNILVEDYGGGPTTFTELHSDERCVYDQGTLREILIEMQEKEIIKVSKINDDLRFIVNIYVPSILSKRGWFDKKREAFHD